MRPPAIAQSYLRTPLSRILGSEASVRVLRILTTRGLPLSVPQLAMECGLSNRGVRLALNDLIECQVVEELGTARSHLFRAETRHPLFAALSNLFEKEQARWDALLGMVRTAIQSQPVAAAWYYGSVARKEDGPASDFDIAVVVIDEAAVESVTDATREALRAAEDTHFLRCSVIGLAEPDVLRLMESGDEWWITMVRDAQVLVGSRPEQYATKLRRRRAAA